MPALKIKNGFVANFIFVMILFLIVSCSSSESSHPKEDKTVLQSCSNLKKEQTPICEIMVNNLGRNPPVYLLHDLLRLVFLVKETASDDSAPAIAEQVMNIVSLRQQQNNNIAIQETFDTLWKIYENTQTQVTFQDLQTALLQPGLNASVISDEQLERMGITMWQSKRQGKTAVTAN